MVLIDGGNPWEEVTSLNYIDGLENGQTDKNWRTNRFTSIVVYSWESTVFAFRFEHRKWNRGRNGLHQLGQPVSPSILFPVFKSEGEPGRCDRDKVSN